MRVNCLTKSQLIDAYKCVFMMRVLHKSNAHFGQLGLRGRVNQCVLMEGLDTPCPSESVPIPLKRLPVPRNEFVSGRAFNACEAPSQGKNRELVQ